MGLGQGNFIDRNNQLVRDAESVSKSFQHVIDLRGGKSDNKPKIHKSSKANKLGVMFMMKAFVRSLYDPSYGGDVQIKEDNVKKKMGTK